MKKIAMNTMGKAHARVREVVLPYLPGVFLAALGIVGVVAAGMRGPVLWGACAAFAGLVAWGGLESRRQSRKVDALSERAEADFGEMSSQTETLIRYLAREFSEQFSIAHQENSQVKSLLADAVEKLVASFTGLQLQAAQQEELAVQLTGQGGAGDKEKGIAVNFDTFLQEVDRVLTCFVQTASENRAIYESLVGKMNRTKEQFNGVLSMLGEVRKIADQTNLLAINAAVEAARAGQAGRGFAVVAEEVRDLSMRSNRFSEQISESVDGISGALSQVEAAIEDMSSRGGERIRETRADVEQLMTMTRYFNSNVEEAAGQISTIAAQVAEEVRMAVTSLQFQDMTSQLIGHVDRRLETLQQVLAEVESVALNTRQKGQDWHQSVDGFKQGLTQASECIEKVEHNPVSQQNLSEGDIELF